MQLRRGSTLAQRLALAVRACDWLARFDVVYVEHGPSVSLRERDGRLLVGRAAVPSVLARLPLTAFFALPWIGFDLLRKSPAA